MNNECLYIGNLFTFNFMMLISQITSPIHSNITYVYTVCTGPFEKLIHVNVLVPLTGKYFCENTSGRMVQTWKDEGTYTDLDAKAVDKYNEVFKEETFMPGGGSILLTFLSDGLVTVSTVT